MIDRLHSIRTSRPLLGREKIKDNKLVFIYQRRTDGSVMELDVDQFSGQPFMQNSNGFICNDIMMFEQCQSDSVARAVLERMKVLHPASYPQDMDIDQMMSCAMPANYGSPAEFVSSQKMMHENLYRLNQKALQKKQADDLKAAEIAREKVLFEQAQKEHELDGSIPISE